MIANLKEGGTFLLNTNMDDETLVKSMPNRMKHLLAEKKAKFYVIDANKLAAECGMGRHTNTTLQAAFFKLSPQIMDYEEAEKWMKKFAEKTYAKKGMEIVQQNWSAIDAGPKGLRQISVDPDWINLSSKRSPLPIAETPITTNTSKSSIALMAMSCPLAPSPSMSCSTGR